MYCINNILNVFIYFISGINKHLNMLIIRELVSKELNLNISTKSIWKYLDKKWNIEESVNNKYYNNILYNNF